MNDGLKQRLIGAIVLLAIAVIFIPALLDRQSITPVDQTSQIPRMPEIVIEPIRVAEPPVVGSPAPPPTEMFIPDENQAVAVSSASIEPVTQSVEPVVKNVPTVKAAAASVSTPVVKTPVIETPAVKTPVAAPKLNEQGVPSGWVLQVISYTEEPKANRFRDQLIADGHHSFVRAAQTPKGLHYRVYVGPKLDQNTLLKSKIAIDQRYKLNTIVLDMTPKS